MHLILLDTPQLPGTPKARHGCDRSPLCTASPMTDAEHSLPPPIRIFSDKAGALGSFAASADFAFGTIIQRVMASPAQVSLVPNLRGHDQTNAG